ncbi:MAG: L,D-transpeptidase family protein [Gaiellaceae bacterium]
MKRFLLVVCLAAIASGAAAPSAKRAAVVPNGVTIGGLRVGGLPVEQARAAISWWYNRPLRFVFYGKRWTVRPSTLGASVDVDSALGTVLKAGSGERVALRVSIDEDRLARYARDLSQTLSVPPRDATATLMKTLTPVLHAGKPGLQVRPIATRKRIEAALRLATRPLLRPVAKTIAPAATLSHFGPVIVIYRGTNKMHVYNGRRPWRVFPVATGQAIYPTPLGSWHIVDMQRNPWWRPPDSPWAKGLQPIPPGPGNPLGTRWMGLDAAGVGMHGTPDAASIGYSASHGCIRMYVPDAEWLFNHVHIGTPVFIVGA